MNPLGDIIEMRISKGELSEGDLLKGDLLKGKFNY
jgi:hypothetical protein